MQPGAYRPDSVQPRPPGPQARHRSSAAGTVTLNAGAAQGFEAGIYRFNKAGPQWPQIRYVGFLDDAFSPQTALIP
jgi:hypothetical protein